MWQNSLNNWFMFRYQRGQTFWLQTNNNTQSKKEMHGNRHNSAFNHFAFNDKVILNAKITYNSLEIPKIIRK